MFASSSKLIFTVLGKSSPNIANRLLVRGLYHFSSSGSNNPQNSNNNGSERIKPSRFDRYAIIKERNSQRKKEAKEQSLIAKKQVHAGIQQELRRLAKNNKQDKANQSGGGGLPVINCEGCSARLQTFEITKYGYIDKDALYQNLTHNRKVIENMSNRTDYTNKAIREVEKQFEVKIVQNQRTGELDLDNVQVLLELESRIDKLNQERQAVIKEPFKRKELLCRRCFYLKHHNQLPDEFNRIDDELLNMTDEQVLLNKIFSKKGEDIYYLYVVDVYDLAGTFTTTVLTRLLQSNRKFSILMSKFDVINKSYFNFAGIKPIIRERVAELTAELKKRGQLDSDYDYSLWLDKIYFVSSENEVGLNKLKQLLQTLEGRVQMVGYPNTGKTSLLNCLTSSKKPTSTVPGTSLSFEIGKFNKTKIFDCPGLNNPTSISHLIKTPNERAILTWKQPKFAPGIMTNAVLFYGGMLVAEGARIIFFGHGGARVVNNDSQTWMKWLLVNYETFWKGLPPLNQLHIRKYQIDVHYNDKGVGDDIEIAGIGFIGLRLCKGAGRESARKVTLYLPESVHFNVRSSLVIDHDVHNKSGIKDRFEMSRMNPVIPAK